MSASTKTSFQRHRKHPGISLVPKIDNPRECDDYTRPIAILPVLSKVCELIVLNQMIEHIDAHSIFHDRFSGYRKRHSTTTLLLRSWDDIYRAMKSGELTMAIFRDFSKAFDTVDHTSIEKNAQHGIFKALPTLDSKLYWWETAICTNQR